MSNSREKYLKLKEKSKSRTSSYISLSDDIVMTIEKILKEKNISKGDFAKLLGKKPSMISKWFNGQHNFTIKTIVDIENALKKKIVQPVINIKRKEEIIIIKAQYNSSETFKLYKQTTSDQESFTFKKMQTITLLEDNGRKGYLN